MTTTRRSFIQKSAVLLAGTAVLSKASWAASKSSDILSIQLYSVRDAMGKDPLGTLKQVAQIGYKDVEHANYVNHKFYGYTAKEFRKVLDDLGLKMSSGHTVLGENHWDAAKKDFTDDWKKLVDDAAYMGQKYVISPWMDPKLHSTKDALLKWLEVYDKCGDLCNKQDMKFGYHNHWDEFSHELDGKKVFDIMMENMDTKKVVMQLDIGNMYIGGAKAIDVVTKYTGKFEMIHVKDEIASDNAEKWESAILGKGIIQVKDVLDICRKTGGTKAYVVEQESYQGKDPIACIKENFEIMKGWGY
jgi:sugar phosphate isomerase/epimerase